VPILNVEIRTGGRKSHRLICTEVQVDRNLDAEKDLRQWSGHVMGIIVV
jgi:hypothetical protein